MKLIAKSTELDQQALEKFGLPDALLMEAAGLQVAQYLAKHTKPHETITFLVGPGNNGGDALVAARHLLSRGYRHLHIFCYWPQGISGLTTQTLRRQAMLLQKLEQPLLKLSEVLEASCQECVELSTWVVDALFGVGLNRSLEGVCFNLVQWINHQRSQQQLEAKVLAIDLPSGLSAETGKPVGTAVLQADVTLTFEASKPGLHLDPGKRLAGEIQVLSIGMPRVLLEQAPADAWLIDASVGRWLPQRLSSAYKNQVGHALVIAGHRAYPGAAWLSAKAAMASGSGLVTLASTRSVLAQAALLNAAEVIHLPLPEDMGQLEEPQQSGAIDWSNALPLLTKQLELVRYQSLLIGPGLGRNDNLPGFLELLFEWLIDNDTLFEGLIVLDADALWALSVSSKARALLVANETLAHKVCLTPHLGEARRLYPKQEEEPISLLAFADSLRSQFTCSIVLKSGTTVVAPMESALPCYISPYGNAGMATAGTGDVLAGLLVGLAAQGACNPSGALGWDTLAPAAVALHGLAGDNAASLYGEACLLASHLIESLPEAYHALGVTIPQAQSITLKQNKIGLYPDTAIGL